MLAFLLQGAAIGLTAAGTPGPLLTFLISRSLSGGWRSGALVALAPLISDPPIVLVILLLLDQLSTRFLLVISVAGGMYVLYLAWGLLRQWRSGQGTVAAESNPSGNLRKAILMNFLSPGPYAFWTLVNGPLLLSALEESIWYGVAFLLGFYGVFIGGMVVLAVIFAQTRRLGPRVVRGMLLASILILTLFGVLLVYKGVTGLVG